MGPLGQRLKQKMEQDSLSCRDVQDVTGISASTISRVSNGGEYSSKTFRQLNAWILNRPLLDIKPIATKKIRVGSNEFLVTIQQIFNSPPPEVEKEQRK